MHCIFEDEITTKTISNFEVDFKIVNKVFNVNNNNNYFMMVMYFCKKRQNKNKIKGKVLIDRLDGASFFLCDCDSVLFLLLKNSFVPIKP